MSNEPNVALYELFEQTIREMLDTATSVNAFLEGTRANGSIYTYTLELLPEEFGRIPWGKVDTVREAYWYPAGRPDRRLVSSISDRLPEFMHVRVYPDYQNNGISTHITTPWDNRVVTVATKGASRPHRDGEYIMCDTDDQVVTTVHQLIRSIFEDYKAEMASRSYDEMYDDDRSRYDPLDERNYPPHER